MWRSGVLSIVFFGAAGCVVTANSPIIARQLKFVSAGHTGCLPDDNEISNVSLGGDGSGLWNATCKGKVYLCSSAGSVSGSSAFSCAPAVQ
jgi:hypothetical protein